VEACDEASIAHERSPASSISRNRRCRSIASGVVRTTPRRSPPTRRGEDREQEEARRRLAARPRDADDLELAGRLAEEDVGRGRHRRARVGDDELRHRQVERPLHDEGDRAPLHRLRREVVAVGALTGNGEEETARRDRARVVRKIAHLDRMAPEHLRRLER
jgi:hypothetical protein